MCPDEWRSFVMANDSGTLFRKLVIHKCNYFCRRVCAPPYPETAVFGVSCRLATGATIVSSARYNGTMLVSGRCERWRSARRRRRKRKWGVVRIISEKGRTLTRKKRRDWKDWWELFRRDLDHPIVSCSISSSSDTDETKPFNHETFNIFVDFS